MFIDIGLELDGRTSKIKEYQDFSVEVVHVTLIDYQALGRRHHCMEVMEILVDRPPSQRRCYYCQKWQVRDGLASKPNHPFAIDASQGCTGCAYSYVDPRKYHRKRAKYRGKGTSIESSADSIH